MVVRVRHCIQDIPCITVGNQKWAGAAPIFRSSEAKISIIDGFLHIIIEVALASIIVDPRACTKKYFRAASEEYELCLEEIIGMKDSRFNSNPIHLVNQELDEIAIIRPMIKVTENIIRAGCGFGIKKRRLLHRRGMSP